MTSSFDSTAHEAANPKDATTYTRDHNASVAASMAFRSDDHELATRGLIATHPTGVIDGPFGPAWDCGAYDFIRQRPDAPDTVNPSLWRQARLNSEHGLFEVDEGLWQVRGYDLSVISFIAGDTGWLIIDPLTSAETAAAALAMANEHLGPRPVKAIIYTHSHVDHYGGVLGVTTREAVAAGEVQVIAPEGFLHEVVSENLIGGTAMMRRGHYQFGPFLTPGEKGHVDAGLGQAVPKGTIGLIAPTIDISHTGQELVVDGIRIVFQSTPDAEAPAEMNFYFPDHRWLCTAENCTHTMHNLIPFRGAQARNSLAWAKYVQEAIDMWGAEAKLVFASHHWPRWGNDEVVEFLTRQRDMYRWVHDQTMRYAAKGYVANEIAEELEMPNEFMDEGHTRGYYGSLVHNVKAVYQFYLSWYDANPAHLWPHPPVEAGKRYVECMGGAQRVLEMARTYFDQGDYRWVAEMVNHLVFADPDNAEARSLQADTLEQLGYQAESSTWRNAYLTGAMELRQGPPPSRVAHRPHLVQAITLAQLVDTMAIRLQSENVGGVSVAVRVELTDSGESGTILISRRSMHFRPGASEQADATIRTDKLTFAMLGTMAQTFDEAVAAGSVQVDDGEAAAVVFAHLDTNTTGFPIVTP